MNNRYTSPQFLFHDFHWNLEIRPILNADFSSYYRISLHTSNKKGEVNRDLCRHFSVTTLLEIDYNGKVLSHVISVETVKSTLTVLWERTWKDAWELIPELAKCTECKIVCIFRDVPPSELQSNKETIHVSTQCDLCSPASLDFPPELENLSRDFSNLLNDKIFPDVKLKCGDRTISAHRAVLAARSEVFAAMFRNKMAESETGVVDVTDLDSQVLDQLLKFLYSGKVQDLSEDTVPKLYAASDKYAVLALKNVCSDWMIRSLTEENFVCFLTAADAHSDAAFKDAVIAFICNHEDLLENDVWLKFSEEHPTLAIGVYQRFVTSKSKNKKLPNKH